MAQLSTLESAARDILATANPHRDQEINVVIQVFTAMWSQSLPSSRVEFIAQAMYGMVELPDLSGALALLVRSKALRVRRCAAQGRVYEINLPA